MQTSPRDDVLLVIDVQNDFCPGGALAVADGDAVVPVINRLRRTLRPCRADPGLASAGPQLVCHQPIRVLRRLKPITMPYGQQTLWPDHCVQGTSGAAFIRN